MSDLTFGAVVQGEPVTIASGDEGAGKFEVAGTPEAVVTVTFGVVSALRDGASELEYAPAVAACATDDGVSATALAGGSGQVTLSEQGRAFLYLGGAVHPLSDQPLGRYAATVEVNVAYP